ncbi:MULTISPECIES: phosphoribosylanthranilate isomerase [Halomicrobium]|uniref:N-(5'-phosphoribosyl)anthranilate isomerase n=2 Tax=Halomicrobium mukohataei TaxID=57705 RepID=C7P462_HALMD|nr:MULTISPECIES: phosphoribosylanthranilate isomerase [Halomicrobium]ACV47884.1 Phosphoribosylanthranilate isomerase [Halomicrobium mukohataei DSM 12286]QCD66324.1 phosphoribosylanthranilate isomerase [Halomicrobium mukohataei]QFR21130.1 phosphoribosylanthranilate isomerase [Halomicrobium sp. ZPS1]
MTRVKVCGITRREDREAVVAAGADAIGVINGVSVDTPREVDDETAAALVAGVPPLVTSVLVTMPEAVQSVARRVETVQPDVVQVHDGLTPTQLGALRRRVDAQLVAVVDAEHAEIEAYADAADALLVDSVDAEGGGGTGETHDWDRTREIVDTLDAPVVLAGGLTPKNVGDAVGTVRPFGVDVASGVEAEGGVKDHDAVRAFVQQAKRADAAAVEAGR